MFNIDTRTTDRDEEGVWTKYEGSDFRIAHVNNPKFQSYFTKLQLPHKRQIDKGTLDADTQLEIMCKAMSRYVLVGWQNVINNDEEPVPYTVDAAQKVLIENADFREFVQDFAMDLSNFREEVISETGKSSSSTSNGS